MVSCKCLYDFIFLSWHLIYSLFQVFSAHHTSLFSIVITYLNAFECIICTPKFYGSVMSLSPNRKIIFLYSIMYLFVTIWMTIIMELFCRGKNKKNMVLLISENILEKICKIMCSVYFLHDSPILWEKGNPKFIVCYYFKNEVSPTNTGGI